MTGPKGADVVRLYFQKWNERKMNDAIDLFTDDCTYEDTLYPEKFVGKDQLRFHLLRVADALPASFAFVVDAVSEGEGEFVGVQWHVENDGKPLPFTRGSSMYTLDPTRTKIKSGFDVPEPTVKSGSFSLGVSTSKGGVWSLGSTLYCGQTIVVTPTLLLNLAPHSIRCLSVWADPECGVQAAGLAQAGAASGGVGFLQLVCLPVQRGAGAQRPLARPSHVEGGPLVYMFGKVPICPLA
jgi:hypothetical protein